MISDPFSTKRSLTRSVNSLTILDFINDCFKIAYLYFGTIQTVHGPVITKIVIPDTNDTVVNKDAETSEFEEKDLPKANVKDDFDNLLRKIDAEMSSAASKPEYKNLLDC